MPRHEPRNEPRRLDADKKCDPRPARPQMTNAQRALATENLKLARTLARAYVDGITTRREELEDELESAAILGLCEAAQAWDPDHGTPFGSFARWRISGAILKALKASIRRGLTGGDDPVAVVPLPDGDAVAAETPPDDDEDRYADPGDERFEAMILPLPDQQRQVIRSIYADGLSRAEAGERIGCTAGVVHGLRHRAIASLRAAAGE